jgi:hypothetical protein
MKAQNDTEPLLPDKDAYYFTWLDDFVLTFDDQEVLLLIHQKQTSVKEMNSEYKITNIE